ncbi:class I SAM-dependent DNA methyltransferase [Lentilactobacillus sp. SPB1-3]|uniref:Class I SAM-dependent DNA methyltransferase n=1 Tax=Lentilactobacillus terminaliae TaxID=3003483 RepID=A0ACD5DFT1_9LACO|nr:DNA methyltransferase [Lentilactobacillus sp. SPB1-3]
MLVTEIEDRITDIINEDNPNQFIYDFMSVYDFPKATITKLKKGINNLSKESGEVYLKNRLFFKQVSGDLMQSFVDAKQKVDNIGSKPRYIMVTDFNRILAEDTKTADTLDIEFKRLPQKFEFFLAWNGIEKADFDKENPADVRAAERFAKLYDVVIKDNPNASRKGLNLFLIRILFCLFAEDTNIFEHDLFTNRVKQMTADDGHDFNDFVRELFGVLDIEKNQRPTDTPSWVNDFPYVDGDLFRDQHESLKFSVKSRKLIIDAGELLNWDQINPDILGSMIQAVASEDSRSHLGMHYTSVPNIMKVIKPLFLDGLREEFESARGNEDKLQKLYNRIGKIKFMDPACGSGNFLIITYKELRQLEIDILIELNNIGVSTMYVPSVTLSQFYGIEIDDFACDVTRLSLWIAEHQMNMQLHEQISDAVRPTLPLQHAGAVLCENALQVDWNNIMPSSKVDESYIFGNPPYVGANNQSDEQKKDLNFVFGDKISTGELDYICGWFYSGARYIQSKNSSFSFVTTNSLTEGKLVGNFWPIVLSMNLEITSAYQGFKWNNNAKNNANVTVEIIQMSNLQKNSNKYLFNNLGKKVVRNINMYLNEGETTIVYKKNGSPLFDIPIMYSGNRATDGKGNLRFSRDEYSNLISHASHLTSYFRKLIGGKEVINNTYNYALWINKEQFESMENEVILNRIDNVRSARKNNPSLRSTPWRFRDTRVPQKLMLVIPATSSENRYYVPMAFYDNNYVANNSTMVIYDSPLWLFGILQSHMHMLWLRKIRNAVEIF